MKEKPLNVFLLFDDDDIEVIETLEKHCKPLEHQDKIRVWHHGKIGIGQLIEPETMRQLENADVILMMITASLLNSERFHQVEPIALQRSALKQSIVIPVYLKHCYFTGFEFTQLKMLPSDGQPVVTAEDDLDERCKEVANEIHQLVETLKEANEGVPKVQETLKMVTSNGADLNAILYVVNDPNLNNPDLINREINCIKQRLLLGKCSCRYEFIPKNVNTIEELQRALLETRPKIVHFSGYSTEEEHITFHNKKGEKIRISPSALCSLFTLFDERLELVFLNACYSETQAEAITEVIPFAIGISGTFPKVHALDFVKAFYQAISYGTSIEKAYRLGRNLLQLKNVSAFNKIVLLERKKEAPALTTGL